MNLEMNTIYIYIYITIYSFKLYFSCTIIMLRTAAILFYELSHCYVSRQVKHL